jgi:hypothetical protein
MTQLFSHKNGKKPCSWIIYKIDLKQAMKVFLSKPIEAKSGEEAIEIYKQQKEKQK